MIGGSIVASTGLQQNKTSPREAGLLLLLLARRSGHVDEGVELLEGHGATVGVTSYSRMSTEENTYE